MPEAGVYLVYPSLYASSAFFIIFCGVLKSGSPILKPIDSYPLLFKYAIFSDCDNVTDGIMSLTLLLTILHLYVLY